MSQFPVSPENVYHFIKENSILRKNANWDLIDQTFNNNLRNATSDIDTMQCFVQVLQQLNDVHSQIFYNGRSYGHYPEFDDSTLARLQALNDKVIQSTNILRTSLINNKYAYVRIPTVSINNQSEINSFSLLLCDSISALNAFKPKGYIIDLRLNGGGNIYPMLAGLSSLLGENTIGFEVDVDGNVDREWKIKDSNFIIGGYQATSLKNKRIKRLRKIPVVVITGPVTRSAGSMVAIAFIGRAESIIIGEPTADGYSTSNNYFSFSPNLTLNFATNYVADRNGVVYKNSVPPEISIYGGDDFENLMNDLKIQASINWFKQR